MAKGLNAGIATEYWNNKESFSKSEAPEKIMVLGKQVKQTGLSYFSAQWRFFWQTKFIRDYDVVIFSGNNCLSAAWRCKKGQRKIMYCHTPVRYAYDLKDYYLKQKVWWKKPLFLFFVVIARVIYQRGINKMDLVMANSKNVQKRLEKYCGVKSVVVNPPIDTDKFSWQPSRILLREENYYLSFGRVDKLKRIDHIVRAFQQIPDKKLIVASGGPELEKIKKMAEGYDNIKVLGFVSDEKLAELVGNCIANIYIPVDEDFGMTPLEAAAAGKPTIGVDEGGLKETIIHKETGYLIPAKYELQDLITAVEWLDVWEAANMKNKCIAQAKKFSKEKFVAEMGNML
jgi:glycosyltransferase involved in cell wall biosynthesis